MEDNIGLFCIINGAVEFSEELKRFDKREKRAVYDVIRVIDGVPLFFEDHFLRMKDSMSLLNLDPGIEAKEMKRWIKKLIEANGKRNCNIKMIMYLESGVRNFLLYVSRSYYPTKEEVEQGVRVSLLHMERENPHVKLINRSNRERAVQKMKEENAFEVLLVNHENRITEGSKSNVFFVKGTRVFTAPDEYVLMGITRKYIVNACRQLGIEVIETLVGIDSMNEIEGLFISGTSIKVLPVSAVDEYSYNSSAHPAILDIRDQFDRIVEKYVTDNI